MSLLETIVLVSAACLVVFVGVFAIVFFGSRGEKRPLVRVSTILLFAPVLLLFRWLYRGDAWDDLATQAAVLLAAAAGTYAAGRLFEGNAGTEEAESNAGQAD